MVSNQNGKQCCTGNVLTRSKKDDRVLLLSSFIVNGRRRCRVLLETVCSIKGFCFILSGMVKNMIITQK